MVEENQVQEEEYLTTRLQDQIDWYESRSASNQRYYKRLRVVELVAAALIPFITGYISDASGGPFRIVVGVLGVTVAALSGLDALYKFHERWMEYRTTAEALKHHKFLYLTRTTPYDSENAFNRLVENVESLISKENSRWTQRLDSAPKEPAQP